MKNARFARLRDQAIAALGGRASQDGAAAAMLQEMEVLQIELELQQEELVESQQRASSLATHYRQLFFDSPCALILLDPQHEVKECNQQALDLLAVSGASLSTYAFERFVSPEDAAVWANLATKAADQPATAELKIRRFGGARRLCSVTLRRHDDGLLLSLDDITDLRAAEEQRRYADERLARVLRDSRDGVVFIDATSGLIAEVNDAFAMALGVEGDQLVGQSLERLFHEPDLVRQSLSFKQATATPKLAGVLSLRFATNRGEVLHTEAVVGRLTEGTRTYVTLLVRDVTSRLRYEAEREELLRARNHSQKMEALGQLAAGIAHDINNVLTAILACASLPKEAQPAEVMEALNDIRLAALRGRDVTGRLGALSRPRPLRPTRFDVCAVLREVHGLLKHSLPRTITLELELPPTPCTIEGDAGEWHQAFLNLAINARDAMPGGGLLRLSAELAGERLIVRVEDTGVGMPPEVLARAFDPFFTTKPVGAGTGLGLSHVHAVARSHGVTPQCTSRPGQGTVFTFQFDHAGLPSPAPAQREQPVRYVGTALVVDDDAAVRRAAIRLLRVLGVESLEAESGEQALAALEREAHRVSIIVTDLTMPGLDGVDLARQARERWPHLPVVVVTGDLTESRRDALEAAQVAGVLTKPYSTEELAGLLQPHLKRATASVEPPANTGRP